jgi:hypothetical protein
LFGWFLHGAGNLLKEVVNHVLQQRQCHGGQGRELLGDVAEFPRHASLEAPFPRKTKEANGPQSSQTTQGQNPGATWRERNVGFSTTGSCRD